MNSNLLLLFLFFSLSAFAQNNASEIISERSMYCKIFDQGENKRQALISGGPIHYLDNGNWNPIQTTITNNGSYFENRTNALKSEFPIQLNSNTNISLTNQNGAVINIAAQKSLIAYDAVNGLTILQNNSNPVFGNINNNTLTYQSIFTDIDEQYIIKNGYVKNELILLNRPAAVSTLNNGFFGYKELIQLPAGWTMASHNGTTNGLTTEPIYIKNNLGELQFIIPTPIFFDNNGLNSDGASAVQGQFLLETNGQSIGLSTLVPVSWLQDPTRNYPVTLDPVTTLAGTNGGWQSPNNFVNNGGFVFVGLCCGNQTHRSWIHFNTAAIPDNGCINSVELQYNCTAVGGAGAETVFLNDVNVVGPGPYPSLNAAAYQDFGDGIYTDFIATGTGNYGFYNLGAQAAVDLQGKLNIDWFEVGSHFLNEPSTNWKRFVANASSLRVDYEVPPNCVLLPISLKDFQVNCQNNQVELSWSTQSEINSSECVLERSENGIEFYTLTTIPAAGNSNSLINYSFTDETPIGETSYYRIRFQSIDGTIYYSPIEASSCAPKEESIQVYPNPVLDNLHIDFLSKRTSTVEILLTDISGKIVSQSVFNAAVGINRFELDISELPAAMYQLMIKTDLQQIMRKISKL